MGGVIPNILSERSQQYTPTVVTPKATTPAEIKTEKVAQSRLSLYFEKFSLAISRVLRMDPSGYTHSSSKAPIELERVYTRLKLNIN